MLIMYSGRSRKFSKGVVCTLFTQERGGGGRVAEDVEMAKNDLLKKIFNLLKRVGCNPVTAL